MPKYSRRDILKNGWKVGGAFLGIAAGWTGYESLRPLVTGQKKSKIAVGKPTSYAQDTATYVPEGRLYMVNAGGHIMALSQKCPHLGCRVPFCDSSGRFECACHGSVYDLGGEYIAGPAPHGMDQFAASLEGGVIVVDLEKILPGPERGAHAFLTPPKGPACKPKG